MAAFPKPMIKSFEAPAKGSQFTSYFHSKYQNKLYRDHNLPKKQLPSECSQPRYIGDIFQNAGKFLKAFADQQ